MKTLKSLLYLTLLFCVLAVSCRKSVESLKKEASSSTLRTNALTDSLTVATDTTLFASDAPADPLSGTTDPSLGGGDSTLWSGANIGIDPALLGNITDLTFCNATVYPLCAGQQYNVGNVTIQTAISGKTYITYNLKNPWFFKEIHLYVGPKEGIPLSGGGNANPGQFPYVKYYATPYTASSCTFVIEGLPANYVVAAHCSVVKISNGVILDAQTGWGDGCSGPQITPGGAWGTYIDYNAGPSCTLAAAANEQVDLCSRYVDRFFGVDPVYNTIMPWYGKTVVVGGFEYTEDEGRVLAQIRLSNGRVPDAIYCMERVATLKLSNTDYTLSPALMPAVVAVETFLANQGKLSQSNLPNVDAQTKNAAQIIDSWITNHICLERR